jgi:hypothetical protein
MSTAFIDVRSEDQENAPWTLTTEERHGQLVEEISHRIPYI